MGLGSLVVLLAFLILATDFSNLLGNGIGVNFGRVANNLPPPDQVVSLLRSNNINAVRLFDPNPDILDLLRGTGIRVILGVLDEHLPALAADPAFAATWVQSYVAPFASAVNLRCIAVGNELIPGQLAGSVLPAMQALRNVLLNAGLQIPVSTAVFQNVIAKSFPPSCGHWHPDAVEFMIPIVGFLQANNYPLLCNVYTYFAYRDDPDHVGFDYAAINSNQVVVQDGGLGYTNLFDAGVDGIYAALEKVGAGNVEIVVSETGWPSAGEEAVATVDNAKAYINNLLAHVSTGGGTPRRPGRAVETYIFALFNENWKPDGSEQHFGLFNPDMTPVYPVNFPS